MAPPAMRSPPWCFGLCSCNKVFDSGDDKEFDFPKGKDFREDGGSEEGGMFRDNVGAFAFIGNARVAEGYVGGFAHYHRAEPLDTKPCTAAYPRDSYLQSSSKIRLPGIVQQANSPGETEAPAIAIFNPVAFSPAYAPCSTHMTQRL